MNGINLPSYPIEDLGTEAAQRLIREQQTLLQQTGVCIMPGFVHEDAVHTLVKESDALREKAHLSDVDGTPYLELPADHWPADHPRKALTHTRLRAVAYDQFPPDAMLRCLYEDDTLMAFISAVLGRAPLFRYADPLGALNLAVMEEGDELGWHFDMTDFVVSLAIQSSRAGGDFVSAQRVRSADDEHYDDVRAVLDGGGNVTTVPMTPGTLMLFEGRYSMHRVTPIVGDIPRYVGLLAYDTKPGTNSSELLKLVRYGRAA